MPLTHIIIYSPCSDQGQCTTKSRCTHNPVAALADLPPPYAIAGTRTWAGGAPRWRWIPTTRTTVGYLAYIIDAATISLGDHVDLTSGVTAHVQSALSIPSKTHRAETVTRALGQVRV
jgi:hypothetical protein